MSSGLSNADSNSMFAERPELNTKVSSVCNSLDSPSSSLFECVKHGTCKVLPHNDPEALESALQRYNGEGRNRYVVMDEVYSQDGDRGLVREYLEISQRYGALLVVDDAHGIGVLGETGGGKETEKQQLPA